MIIRPATADDAPWLAMLLHELAYPSDRADVVRRLTRLAARPDHQVLVAVATHLAPVAGCPAADRPVGVCHVQAVPLLASDGYAEVLALVVSSHHRRQGVGTRLVAAAAAWAGAQGLGRLRLRSGVHREEAHRFYASLGFSRSRASYAFERTWGSDG